MKSAFRAAALALAWAGLVADPARAQVPNVQVYFDADWTQSYTYCESANTLADLYVVLNNCNFEAAGVDFSINYPPMLIWLVDNLPDPDVMAIVGHSPTGVAVAWGGCCIPDGTLGPILLLKPLVLWAGCYCPASQAIEVRGYAPLGKAQPTVVRYPDFKEITIIGMTSLLCEPSLPVESTTWGAVKALYR